jgi:hypothetical protein
LGVGVDVDESSSSQSQQIRKPITPQIEKAKIDKTFSKSSPGV